MRATALPLTDWFDTLGYAETGDALVTDRDQIGHRPYAAELHDLLDPDGAFRLVAVFLVDRTPTICFADGEQLTTDAEVNAVRQRLWNQNLVSGLVVFNEDSARAYSIPKWQLIQVADVVPRTEARPDGHWSASEVRSSDLQQRLSDWFDPSQRVDRHLLRQLSLAVTRMTAGDRPLISSQLNAQMLLAQVLFVSYLEHRGIVGEDYREVHHLRALAELVSKGDGRGIDLLISRLKKDFNGDFLETSEIHWGDLDPAVLGILGDLLSRVDLKTGQRDFWNYDFSQIPVELLSGIYETFLQDERKVDGAYYTPRVLAELAAEQAFEGLAGLTTLRIYDGACGSGILLTTAFRKIIAYRQAELGRFIGIRERIDLLRTTIFGGDISPMACRVTAFSLYLCLLERLSPPDLLLLQRDHDCQLPPLIGTNLVQGEDTGDFFSPSNPFSASASFDIVLSNPPWRELRADEAPRAVAWAEQQRIRMPHRQIAAAYAAKATDAVRSGGRIVLILPTSLITAPTNADFLRQTAVRTTVERMINLSDFRRLLFAEAEHACTIMRTENRPGLDNGRVEGFFEYWTPKVDISFAFNRLTLHDYDRATLPRSSLIEGNDALRRQFWGSRRDESLFRRMAELPQIGDAVRASGWIIAKGYHMRDGIKSVPPDPLSDYRFLPTVALNSDSPIVDLANLIQLPIDRGVASYGEMALYKGERILWPDGTSVEMEIRAAYTDEPFCFVSGVGGLRLTDGERRTARFLTCYLRSSLAKYWLILTGYTAQTERARVTLTEVKSLPFIPPDRHPDPIRAAGGLTAADQLLARFETTAGTLFAASYAAEWRAELDTLIFDYFGLSPHERVVVADMVRLVAESLQPTSYGELLTPLQRTPSAEDVKAYLRQLEDGLITYSRNKEGQGNIRVRLVGRDGNRMPLDIVHVVLEATDSISRSQGIHINNVRATLRSISEEIADGRAIDFFTLSNSIFVWGDDVFVVKPARMRFWSLSAALRDADDIVSLLTSPASDAAVGAVKR